MNKFKIYLAGAMEFSNYNDAMIWRTKVEEKLANTGIEIFNPVRNEVTKSGMTFHEIQIVTKRLKTQITKDKNAVNELIKINNNIWKFDLENVDNSDILFVYFDARIISDGTKREIYRAYDKGIPIYLICHHKYEIISTTIIGYVLENGKLFHSIYRAIDEVIKVYKEK